LPSWSNGKFAPSWPIDKLLVTKTASPCSEYRLPFEVLLVVKKPNGEHLNGIAYHYSAFERKMEQQNQGLLDWGQSSNLQLTLRWDKQELNIIPMNDCQRWNILIYVSIVTRVTESCHKLVLAVETLRPSKHDDRLI